MAEFEGWGQGDGQVTFSMPSLCEFCYLLLSDGECASRKKNKCSPPLSKSLDALLVMKEG